MLNLLQTTGNVLHQFISALVGNGRNGKDGIACRFCLGFECRPALAGLWYIHFVEDDNLWAGRKLFIILTKFRINCLEVLPWVALQRGTIDHVDQQASALYMTEELMTKADALGSPFDQSRNIGQNEAEVISTARQADNDNTEIGRERGEGIISNLGSCSSHDGEQG